MFHLREWKAKVPKEVKDHKHPSKLPQPHGHCCIFYNNHLIDFPIPCLHNLLNVACFECMARKRGKCFKAYQDKTQKLNI